MGIKYQIRKGNEVVKQSKSGWDKYSKKKGYELFVWIGKGKGWRSISRSK